MELDDEFFDLPLGELAVKLCGTTKPRIRSQWANALLVKIFGKTIGYNYLRSRVMGLWKPMGRMDLEMTVVTRPVGTRPGPTLMGWVLPDLINNRAGFRFLK